MTETSHHAPGASHEATAAAHQVTAESAQHGRGVSPSHDHAANQLAQNHARETTTHSSAAYRASQQRQE